MNILFVCTGNTCRSPMAEAVFNHLCCAKKLEHQAFSRGLNVIIPQPVSSKSVEALKNKNIELKKTFSQQLTNEDVKNADLILTMTSGHKMTLKSVFSEHKDKIYTLNEKAFSKDSDIADPFGGHQDVYNKCCEEITGAVEELLCTL